MDKIEFRGRKVSKEPLETSYSRRGLEIENDDYLFYLKFSPLLGEDEALDFSWSFRVKSTKEQESRTDAKCESK